MAKFTMKILDGERKDFVLQNANVKNGQAKISSQLTWKRSKSRCRYLALKLPSGRNTQSQEEDDDKMAEPDKILFNAKSRNKSKIKMLPHTVANGGEEE